MQSKSSHIPLMAAFGVCIIFSWLVGYGWYRTFNSWTANLYFAVCAGAILSLIAMVLGLAIAKERVNNHQNISTALSYFFILILLSALGTINTLYFNVSGARIVQDEIKGALHKINGLKTRAPILLATPAYDAWSKKVEEAENNVYEEIRNTRLCGQGPEAQKRIEELRNLLPSFKPLAGQGCDKVEDLIGQYQSIIKKQVQLSQETLIASDFLSTKNYIEKSSAELEGNLTKLLEKTNKASDIEMAKIELRKAVEEFSKMKDKVEILSGKGFDQSFIIDTKGIDSIGNPGEILSFMASRLNEFNTYVYLIIALLIDITLISAFKAVIETDPKSEKKKPRPNPEDYM